MNSQRYNLITDTFFKNYYFCFYECYNIIYFWGKQIMIIGFIPEGLSALFFIFSGLAIASFIKQARKSYSFIPYAPLLFFISIFIGYTH